MVAYSKDSFVYGNKIDNLSKFDDNLEVLEAYDDEEDDEDSFCLCGKANDDKMIMCESEECAGYRPLYRQGFFVLFCLFLHFSYNHNKLGIIERG